MQDGNLRGLGGFFAIEVFTHEQQGQHGSDKQQNAGNIEDRPEADPFGQQAPDQRAENRTGYDTGLNDPHGEAHAFLRSCARDERHSRWVEPGDRAV
ncbi:hypothetical protein D3C77_593390 [compost metagenome]